jgi:hypothetical protein
LEDPLPPAEIEEKFRNNASLALPKEKVEAIVGAVRNLENRQTIGAVADLLAPS